MRPGPSKWLQVRYEDEGSNQCFCLSCKNHITSSDYEMRGLPWKDGMKWRFCPWCGIEWQGESLQSEKSKKRKHLIAQIRNKEYTERQENPLPHWEIQQRMIWNNGDPPSEWVDSGYWFRERKEVVKGYKALIEDEDDYMEFRVARIYPKKEARQVLGPEKGRYGRSLKECPNCGGREIPLKLI